MKNFVTIISDNQSKSSALLSEHGLALKIHYNNKNILFDTGSNKTILHNLKELNINIKDFDFAFCSHGHYDHTGGFGILPIIDKPIYIGKDFFKDCYSVQLDGSVKKISIPQEAKVKLENSPKVKTISSFTNLGNGIYSTGIIPLLEDNQSNKVFYSNEAATEINYIVDEQSMLLDNGTLITGCCHAGIKNTIIHCQHYHPEIKIKTIIGGLHLLLANSNQLQEVVQYLNSLSLEKIVLLHCTGLEAENFLKEQLNTDVFIGYSGLTISI
jgi:7,8-dihydropterin-6-yl-methyl-4-(beta-D-ribofuranosyl)aminobenzene 5'-phosphate synthase